MPKIEFFHADTTHFIDLADGRGGSRQRHRDGDEGLHAFEVRLPAHFKEQVHAHKEDEIIHVVAGEMSMGKTVLKAGDSVFISGLTLYGFQTGPEGVTFVNFRKRFDMTFYTSDQLQEYRTLDPAAQAAMDERLATERIKFAGWNH